MDDATLKSFAQQVDQATLALPHAETTPAGRQNDPGANLQAAGVLIIPLATDPGVPGAIFAADLVELRAGRQGWHRVVTVRDGDEGDRTNVKPLSSGGDAALILGLLQGNLLPGILSQVTAGGDPLRLLAQLLAANAKK